MLNEIKHTKSGIEDSISFLSRQYEVYKNEIDTLEAQRIKDANRITFLENKLDDMLLYNSKCNLEIKKCSASKVGDEERPD